MAESDFWRLEALKLTARVLELEQDLDARGNGAKARFAPIEINRTIVQGELVEVPAAEFALSQSAEEDLCTCRGKQEIRRFHVVYRCNICQGVYHQ